MGDDGIKYDMFTPKLLEKMNALVGEADIITPNLTELCLLTDADYDAIIDIADTRILIDVIGELASTLLPPDSDNSNTLDSRQTSKKEKEIIVIPTKTVPQGITAIINFMPDADAKTNEEAMLEEIKNVKTGQVTYAVRDTHIDDKEIHEGDIMGIGDSGILAVGKDLEETTKELIANLVDEDSELISIYYGEEVSEEDAEKFTEEITELYPDVDVDIQFGGCWHVVSRGFFCRYSLDSSLLKAVYDPKASVPHAASLRQGSPHCARFPTAASRRSLGRVSVPIWPVGLSTRLPVVGTVGRHPAVYLMGRGAIPSRRGFSRGAMRHPGVSGITRPFGRLSRGRGQVLHVLLSRSPLASTRR